MGVLISPKWWKAMPGMLVHWCPGCKERHIVYIQEEGANWPITWGFNFDYLKSTLYPSISHKTNKPRNIGEMNVPVVYTQCHYFIRDGQIDFCPDCVHPLAGKTVPLPDLPNFKSEE